MSDCSTKAFKVPEKHKLKPCPFCGGEAAGYPYSWTVKCKECGTRKYGTSYEEAIEAWNTRHEPTCTLNEEEITGFEGISFTIASCSHCGKLTFPGVRYCQSCGRKVVGE